MDFVTLLGLIIGLGGILGGMVLEGGHMGSLIQGTAAVIVFGGTFGAVLVSTSSQDLRTGLRLFKWALFKSDPNERERLMKQIIESAQIARKESILALERKLNTYTDPFMQNVFRFVIDGVEPNTLRDIFEAEVHMEQEALRAGAKIWQDAGGFAPTIGIIGAVLGLIHVMQNVSDTAQLAAGIAVAFVATVYGVGSANLIFLPIANKIKRRIQKQLEIKMMILEGAVGIMNGMNPFIIEEKLRSFVSEGQETNRQRAA